MIPLERELTDHGVSEVFSLVRRATRSATTALSHAAGCDARPPLPIGEIAQRTGFQEEDCREALVKLIEEGVVLKSGRTRGTRYQLAEDE